MDAMTCIKTRMSIRGFRPEPVPRELLIEIFEAARRSPSYKNSQPWEVMVLSGEKKKALTAELIRLFESDAPLTPDLPAPGSWPAAEDARIKQLFISRREATGIDLGDPKVVRKSKRANFSFYGAPHALYLYQDSSLSQWSLFDLGLFAQSLMLAAHARGIGSVPQAFVTDYARETKEFLGIPADKRLVLGMSLGFPEPDSRVNQLTTDRSPLTEVVSWME